MCIGFAVGDLIYFWAAEQQGYSEPFTQLPELSVLVVTLTMTAPMTAWMLFRGMSPRATAEMSAVMPVAGDRPARARAGLQSFPWGSFALLEHGLMMPAMLLPMLYRLDLYAGRSGFEGHHWQRGALSPIAASPGHRHRALLAAAWRRRPLRPPERARLRVVRSPVATPGRCDLYHSALEVHVPEARFVIEQAPAWRRRRRARRRRRGPGRHPRAGRFRLFRYEVRRWRDGVIPDAAEAVESPHAPERRDRLRAATARAGAGDADARMGPRRTGTGEMWNSTRSSRGSSCAVVSTSSPLAPPRGGRAPGWNAGIVIARRQQADAAARTSPAFGTPPNAPAMGRLAMTPSPRRPKHAKTALSSSRR